jgi:hypothetical protein
VAFIAVSQAAPAIEGANNIFDIIAALIKNTSGKLLKFQTKFF